MGQIDESLRFEESMYPQQILILEKCFGNDVTIERANEYQDGREATDLILTKNGNVYAIGSRVRKGSTCFDNKSGIPYRDLTIRKTTLTGMFLSEWEKIKSGYGDYYIYSWTNELDKLIVDWIIVDLNQFRKCGLAQSNREAKPNKDENDNWFYVYPLDELFLEGCLMRCCLDNLNNDRLQQLVDMYCYQPIYKEYVAKKDLLVDNTLIE